MELWELTWPTAEKLSPRSTLVVPIAAVEQHGRHLPLGVDSMLLGEIVRRAQEQLADRVVFTPLLWLGNSHHHLDFAGTLSAAPRAYLELLVDLVENLLTHGFRKVVLLNGHGGNVVPAQQALFEVRQRHRRRDDLLLLLATYWALGGDKHDKVRNDFVQAEMGHACEWETSMMLRLAPRLVGDLGDVRPVPQGNAFAPAQRAWVTQDRSADGHIGDPRSATAEKGEVLFERFTSDVVNFLLRVADWDSGPWCD